MGLSLKKGYSKMFQRIFCLKQFLSVKVTLMTVVVNSKKSVSATEKTQKTKIRLPAVGRGGNDLSFGREVWDSISGPVKSDTVLPTAHHGCDIFLELEAVSPRRYAA